ncbi:MAG: hypothetical protein LRY49_10250 [Burkholderiaceae bacterium]|nr:hypothetical protein [Burkholderiaceae bacterium]
MPGSYLNIAIEDAGDDQHFAGYFIATVFWTIYLYTSKRVRNTYYPNRREAPNKNLDTVKPEPLDLDQQIRPATLDAKAKPVGDKPLGGRKTEPFKHLQTDSHSPASSHAEENAYAAAMNEIDTKQMRTGLWAKLWAEFDGDERLVTAKYLRTRAAEILSQPLEGQNTAGPRESGVEDKLLKEQKIHERELRTLLLQGQEIAAEKLQIKWALRNPEKKQACLELLEQLPNHPRELQPRIALLELLGGHVKWNSDQYPSYGGDLHFAGLSRALSDGAKISEWIDDHLVTAVRVMLK